MQLIQIFDPSQLDPGSQQRGGGRFFNSIKENIADKVEFIHNVTDINPEATLFIPFFNPFMKPFLTKKIAKKQILVIPDVIPLKYPSHFPVGMKGSFNLFLNKRTLKNYDFICTISETSKKDIITYLGVPEEKIKVIYQTLTKEFIGEKNPILNPSPFCLYVGDVNWNKNIVNLAKAIKLANIPCVFVGKAFEMLQNSKVKIQSSKSQFKSQKLNAIGGTSSEVLPTGAASEAWEKELGTESVASESLISSVSHPWQLEFKNFIQEVENNPLFVFLGYVSDEELISLYQSSTLNLLLSRDEGFGYSYLEAASQHIPSLLTDIPVFHEIAEETAFFTDPENPEKIALYIKNIFADEKKRNELSEKAYKRSLFFSPEFVTDSILKVCNTSL